VAVGYGTEWHSGEQTCFCFFSSPVILVQEWFLFATGKTMYGWGFSSAIRWDYWWLVFCFHDLVYTKDEFQAGLVRWYWLGLLDYATPGCCFAVGSIPGGCVFYGLRDLRPQARLGI